jgi:adenylate cyclase
MEEEHRGDRKLAAVMFTDILGYTALTQADEALALRVLERHNRLLRPFFQKFRGREVKTIGDSFLVEFDSALDAALCAVEIQKFLHDYNVSTNEDWKIKLRIGIHLGDIVRKNNDILGDAVNIASRIEPLCDPEGVCISEQVYDQVHNKIDYSLRLLKKADLKNVKFSTAAYAVVMPWEKPKVPRETKSRRRPRAEPTIAQDRRRVAVLPFSNLSPDPNDEYFADGITEELISTISKVSGLDVIARTSILRYKGGKKNIDEIGKELKVGTILEGSVRKDRDKLRITTQLIDAHDSRHLWSETYDRKLKDVFAIQSDIANTVAAALKITLLPAETDRIRKVPTSSTAAYSFYLKGMQNFVTFTAASHKKATECFLRAIELDPNFALAYAGLGFAYSNGVYLPAGSSYEDAITKARDAITKALEIDDESAEAHVALANIEWFIHGMSREGWLAQEREGRRAIELNPNLAHAHAFLGSCFAQEGRFQEAKPEIERAIALDPLSPIYNILLGTYYYWTHNYGQALEHFNDHLLMHGEIGADTAHRWLARINIQLSRFDEAAAHLEQGIKITDPAHEPFFKANLALTFAKQGKESEARVIINELKTIPKEEENLQLSWTGDLAAAHLALGDKDEAFRVLERAYERKEVLSFASENISLKVDPFFDGIRSDPRFVALLTKIGLLSPDETAKAEMELQKATKNVFDKKRIAILPFSIISPDPTADEYFADGITEELISTMSKISGLKVIARTSVMAYKGEKKKINDVAKELEVGTVLEGSVRKASNRLRITAQLIDTESSEHLWSETFDRELKDVFAIQSEISEIVASALKVKLVPKEKIQLHKEPTKSVEAHELYLKGFYYNTNGYSAEDFEKGIKYLEQAIELDPSYALAYACLADTYASLAERFFVRLDQVSSKAKKAVRKALELDPDSAYAHLILGFVKQSLSLDWKGAESEMRKALELDPSVSNGHAYLVVLLLMTGRYDEALEESKKALDLDPISYYTRKTWPFVLYAKGEYTRAIESLKNMQSLYPHQVDMAISLALSYIANLQFDNAIDELQAVLPEGKDDPWLLEVLGMAYAKSGSVEKARRVLGDLTELAKTRLVPKTYLATIHAALAEHDEAIRLLEQAYDAKEFGRLSYMKLFHQFDDISSDPRFVEISKKLGLE